MYQHVCIIIISSSGSGSSGSGSGSGSSIITSILSLQLLWIIIIRLVYISYNILLTINIILIFHDIIQ